MEKVIYSNNGGAGVILESDDIEMDIFTNKSFVINGVTLNIGDMTDLFGLFDSPVRYAGTVEDNCMAFYLGADSTLFGAKHYYSCFWWISEFRLANKYSHNTCRDFNWIGGRWK